ncbi:hypothetical protein B0A50_05876 [Salinomyces thailandicus]|uniref:Uncharacterized protein n=1 Tax=Salinomyces thailandicus TaxID=706561 RepID=A0A4U0TSP2_9PEZI|nr:hypothetical protein B0A50_05876 [Salinomyces thailandica]
MWRSFEPEDQDAQLPASSAQQPNAQEPAASTRLSKNNGEAGKVGKSEETGIIEETGNAEEASTAEAEVGRKGSTRLDEETSLDAQEPAARAGPSNANQDILNSGLEARRDQAVPNRDVVLGRWGGLQVPNLRDDVTNNAGHNGDLPNHVIPNEDVILGRWDGLEVLAFADPGNEVLITGANKKDLLDAELETGLQRMTPNRNPWLEQYNDGIARSGRHPYADPTTSSLKFESNPFRPLERNELGTAANNGANDNAAAASADSTRVPTAADVEALLGDDEAKTVFRDFVKAQDRVTRGWYGQWKKLDIAEQRRVRSAFRAVQPATIGGGGRGIGSRDGDGGGGGGDGPPKGRNGGVSGGGGGGGDGGGDGDYDGDDVGDNGGEGGNGGPPIGGNAGGFGSGGPSRSSSGSRRDADEVNNSSNRPTQMRDWKTFVDMQVKVRLLYAVATIRTPGVVNNINRITAAYREVCETLDEIETHPEMRDHSYGKALAGRCCFYIGVCHVAKEYDDGEWHNPEAWFGKAVAQASGVFQEAIWAQEWLDAYKATAPRGVRRELPFLDERPFSQQSAGQQFGSRPPSRRADDDQEGLSPSAEKRPASARRNNWTAVVKKAKVMPGRKAVHTPQVQPSPDGQAQAADERRTASDVPASLLVAGAGSRGQEFQADEDAISPRNQGDLQRPVAAPAKPDSSSSGYIWPRPPRLLPGQSPAQKIPGALRTPGAPTPDGRFFVANPNPPSGESPANKDAKNDNKPAGAGQPSPFSAAVTAAAAAAAATAPPPAPPQFKPHFSSNSGDGPGFADVPLSSSPGAVGLGLAASRRLSQAIGDRMAAISTAGGARASQDLLEQAEEGQSPFRSGFDEAVASPRNADWKKSMPEDMV